MSRTRPPRTPIINSWKKYTRSNAGYHHLGCSKNFALMGKAFAEATLQLPK